MRIALGITAALLLVLIGIYFYHFIRRFFKTLNVNVDTRNKKIIFIVLSVIVSLSCLYIFGIQFIILAHLIVLGCIMDIINLLIKKISKEKYDSMKWFKKIYGLAIIPIVITIVLIIYGHINIMNVVETNYDVIIDKSLREEGYKVALIADVHFGVSVDSETLQEICNEIQDKTPDMVVLCGDIVDENASKEDMKDVFKTFGEIDSEFGTFYVYGNHDRQLYSNNKSYSEEELRETIEAAGIRILQDEYVEINDEVVLVGREDAGYARSANTSERKSIESILDNVDKDKLIITLDHQPKQYAEESEAGTDLLLSGHTHAGQIWPANILFEIVKFDDAVYGETIVDKMHAIVTSGFAGWGYSVKTSSPAEYVIINVSGK